MGEVTAQQVEIARAPQGKGKTEDVMRGLGDRDRLTTIDESLSKCAQLRQAPGCIGPGTSRQAGPEHRSAAGAGRP